MTQILYILDSKNILLSESEFSADEIIRKMETGSWRFPFHYDKREYRLIEGVLVVSGKRQKKICPELNERQIRVIERLIDGDSIEQVARALHISVYTVKYHIKSAKQIYNVDTRSELIARYSRDLTIF